MFNLNFIDFPLSSVNLFLFLLSLSFYFLSKKFLISDFSLFCHFNCFFLFFFCFLEYFTIYDPFHFTHFTALFFSCVWFNLVLSLVFPQKKKKTTTKAKFPKQKLFFSSSPFLFCTKSYLVFPVFSRLIVSTFRFSPDAARELQPPTEHDDWKNDLVKITPRARLMRPSASLFDADYRTERAATATSWLRIDARSTHILYPALTFASLSLIPRSYGSHLFL